ADLDTWSAGLDVTLGMECAAGARWSDIMVADGRLRMGALRDALPHVPGSGGRVMLLGCGQRVRPPVDPAAVASVLAATRKNGDPAVVDLPIAPSPAADAAITAADMTVVVVPADVRGCFGAAHVVTRLRTLSPRVGIV